MSPRFRRRTSSLGELTANSMDRAFIGFLRARSLAVPTLRSHDLVDSMMSWYVDARVVDADAPERDGDMLLSQWGTWSNGGERTWQFDMTRQVTTAAEHVDDQEMWQFSTRMHFVDSEQTRAIPNADRWCRTPGEIGALREFVLSSPAFAHASENQPVRVTVHNSRV